MKSKTKKQVVFVFKVSFNCSKNAFGAAVFGVFCAKKHL